MRAQGSVIPYATLGDMVENGAHLNFYCDQRGCDLVSFDIPMQQLVVDLGGNFMPGNQKEELLRYARCPACRRCDMVTTKFGLDMHRSTSRYFDGHRCIHDHAAPPTPVPAPEIEKVPWPKRRQRSRYRSNL